MNKVPQKLQEWIDARQRHKLSDAQILMARELGLKPSSLRKLTTNKDQKWKESLAEYIEYLYEKRFKRSQPAEIISIEKMAQRQAEKEAEKRAAKEMKKQQEQQESTTQSNESMATD